MSTHPPGRRPYGDTEAEAETIRLGLEMRNKGMTWRAIAEVLNLLGHPRRNGTPWGGPNLAQILRRSALLTRDD